MPKLNQDNMQEFICEIIEHFENFLEEKGITIENPEKQEAIDAGEDPESICNIYGTDYGWLQSECEELIDYWKLLPEASDDAVLRVIPEKDMLVSMTMIHTDDEYKDCVACKCGNLIYFKNRKPYEPVTVICPKCKFVMLYG